MRTARRDRVLVTDGETRAVVSLARGLHQAGFQVAVAGSRGAWPIAAHWSAAVAERLLLPSPLADEPAFLDELEQAVRKNPYAILLPGSDASLLAISRERGRLEPHVRLALPPHPVVQRSLDKLALMAASARHGLDSPRTFACEDGDTSVAAAYQLGFPVVVKPVSSVFEIDRSLRRAGTVLVRDEASLRAVVGGLGDRYLVQQREPGFVVSFAGVFAGGRLLAQAMSRYHRTWHPDAGSAAYSETIETPRGLSDTVARLLDEVSWEGMFELELIERPDGGCAAIDMNPRPYGSVALAIAAGANLPAIWCEHVLGRRPRPAVARPGVFYRWTDADLRHAVSQARQGRTSAALEVLKIRRGVVHPYFSLRDPGPFAARACSLASDAVRRRRTGADAPAAATRGHQAAGIGRRPERSPRPVAVIGAGPHGLAAAAHLRAAGIATACFGEPFESWREHMPAGMILRSRKRSSSIADPRRELTIDHFEIARRTTVRVPSLRLEEFVDYGLWFQRQAVPDLDQRKVQSLERDQDGFNLLLEDGTQLGAARVVVAAGLSQFPHRPPPLDSLPAALVSHSSEHADLAVFRGRRVLVLGAGQSALESAALLHERGATVEVLARTSSINWLGDDTAASTAPRARGRRFAVQPPPTDVGGRLSGWLAAAPELFRRAPRSLQTEVAARCLRPAGSGWLRPRLASVPVTVGRSVVAARGTADAVELSLDDGSTRSADHVLLGTGYAIDVTQYSFLTPELIAALRLAEGYPVLGAQLESSVAGLHFVGAPAAFSFGPIMRFVVGSWYSAAAVTSAALGRRRPPRQLSF